MNIKQNKDELDLAVEEFEKTFKDFEKAAKNLMVIMDIMNKEKYEELDKYRFITIEEFEKLIKIDLQTGEINNDFYREADVNKIYWFVKALYRHNIVEEDRMKNIIRKIFMEDIEN